MTANCDSIEALTAYCHQLLDRIMVRHQECLLEQNLDLAQRSYDVYCTLMRSHIEIENHVILPLWQTRLNTNDKNCVKWPPVIYFKEHEKLIKMLAKAQVFLDRCHQVAQHRMERRLAILAALDYQRSLKNVAEHHEQREEQGMLPELERALTASDHQALLAQCLEAWQPAVAQAEVFLSDLALQLDTPVP